MISNRLLLTFLLSILLSSCALFNSREKSMKENLYWSQIVEQSRNSKSPFINTLKNESPAVYQQVKNDSLDPLLLTFWGKSLNFDSGAKKQIIDEEIINGLHAQFNVADKFDIKIVHAGIAHTYGYLFSVLDTPYGYKRKRWIEPTINEAFSLKGLSLSPETIDGGLLSNVTYFAGTLAFSLDSDRQKLKDLKNVSNEVRSFNYFALTIEHLDEELPKAILRTTLLKFPVKADKEENEYLLIYTILNKELKKEELITVFPITKEAYKKIVAPENLGPKKPVSIRYNAYLEGLMDQKLIGNRRFWIETR